jgi:hypothetical protein
VALLFLAPDIWARLLLEEIINPPCPYVEGTFEPSFFPSHFRPLSEHKTDISVLTAMLNKTPEKV